MAKDSSMADLLFPESGRSAVQTPDEVNFWRAWYPQVPYTGSLAQQQELVRLRDMQDGNMATIPQVPVDPQQAQALQTMQHGVPTMQDGVAVMPPLQAVGRQVAPPGPAGDQMGQLQKAPMEIPVIGGTVADRPALSMPPYFPPGVAPQELGWQAQKATPAGAQPPVQGGGMSPLPALSMPPYFPPSVAPQEPPKGMQQAPMGNGQTMPGPSRQPSPAAPPSPAVPVRPIGPPASPEEYQQRATGWKGMLDNLKRPEVMGPLQTFFGALSAPLAPWETPGSRIARASSLMQMHKGMLDENLRTHPMRDEQEQLALEQARLDVEGKKSDVKKKGSEAEYADKTLDARVKKAQEDLENAIADGDLKAEQLAAKKLEVALEKEFGKEKAKAELDNIRSQIETRRQTVGIAAKNAETSRINATKPKAGKGLAEMSDAEVMNEINAVARAFRDTGAAAEDGANYMEWLSKTYGTTYARELNRKIAELQAKGLDVNYRTSADSRIQTPTGAAGAAAAGNDIPWNSIQ